METWRRDMSAVSRLKSANTTVCCNHFNHCNRPQYDTGFRMDFLFSPLRTPCTFFERAASTPSTAEHWPITRHGCNALCCYFCCNALCCYFCSRRQAVQGVLLRWRGRQRTKAASAFHTIVTPNMEHRLLCHQLAMSKHVQHEGAHGAHDKTNCQPNVPLLALSAPPLTASFSEPKHKRSSHLGVVSA